MSSSPRQFKRVHLAALFGAFVFGGVLVMGLAALLLNINERQVEARVFPAQIQPIPEGEIDPAVWGMNFPRQYASFMETKEDTLETPFGGSKPIDKLERYPVLTRLWAGYAFSVAYSEERGHYYALIDQKETKRQEVVKQPGACANCHAGEAPSLIASMGWEAFNKTPYAELSDKLHSGSVCADCHEPNTMTLRVTRPAFMNAMAVRGVDIATASRQEMRTYVCAQCHVEYYFAGEGKALTFPWKNGLSIDAIDQYYQDIAFTDFKNKETGAGMIKIQHPEYEMFSSSLHARSGVSCADCHMPYVREGAVKVSDHHWRSPIANISNACQTCHKFDEATLRARIDIIQNNTSLLLRSAESALTDAMDAIIAARNGGATDETLSAALIFIRRAQMRWDFVFSENSTGFHNPQESARVLGDAINFARQAQIEAIKLTPPAP
ncbi:MAG TPA: ammonia-forming cytochrome c nitrite reductase subunit c552 [Aggregatilineales bacterium]|nr:ammonia-forming cytochrome c nitrite reductase subunit c552 [Anaerolineales bacterium]HRE47908.1 ammonia-forming cytochrome c nitrite reductase subunit c552 [Aggregatilineales bacterium]